MIRGFGNIVSAAFARIYLVHAASQGMLKLVSQFQNVPKVPSTLENGAERQSYTMPLKTEKPKMAEKPNLAEKIIWPKSLKWLKNLRWLKRLKWTQKLEMDKA